MKINEHSGRQARLPAPTLRYPFAMGDLDDLKTLRDELNSLRRRAVAAFRENAVAVAALRQAISRSLKVRQSAESVRASLQETKKDIRRERAVKHER